MIYSVALIHDGLSILPHFLQHYRDLGVDRILLGAETRAYDEAHFIAKSFDVQVAPFRQKRFNDPGNQELEELLLRLHGVEDDDYVLYLDCDEFQEYPAPLKAVVAEMDKRNIWAARGWFIDRLAPDGKFRPILPAPSLDRQFPVKCHATRNIVGGWDQKIMICRGRVRLKGGHHDTFNAMYDIEPILGAYRVHHYKWTEGVEDRMSYRGQGSTSPIYHRETESAVQIARQRGGFDLNDPRLDIE
ncbi:MAG TPA: glycosyltransferase family 2 protein [Pirellulales bacterium]|jgi:hypothetical protein|nr:glycosyltransferase family 2 protein [Pirellulales bacterium]